MIAYLAGPIISRGINSVILAPQGVGYRVQCPARMLQQRGVGDFLEIFVKTVQTEHETFLYGFTDEESLEMFDALTGIQGIGAKTALSILDAMRCSEIVRTLHAENKDAFGRIKGVGPKTATRIVSELSTHPFVTSYIVPADEAHAGAPAIVGDEEVEAAIGVLVNLGYKRQEAKRSIEKALKAQPGLTRENLVVAALRAGVD